MFTAAELIETLHRRLRLQIRRGQERPPGEFPPGWSAWFAELGARRGRVVGALPEDIIGILAQRPLARPPRRVGELTRWQAFNAIWRQQWHPPEPDERGIRRASIAITIVWHFLFAIGLLWLLVFQYLGVPPEPASAGEQVVQVEYVGRGTPEDTGGGPKTPEPDEAAMPAAEASPQAAAPSPPGARIAVETPSIEAPVPDVPQRDVPEPQLPLAEAEQPVAVSEPRTGETTVFVLPPTRRLPEREVRVPEIAAPGAQVRMREVPEPVQPIRRALPQPEIGAPELTARAPTIPVREVPAPLPTLPSRAIAQPDVRVPDIGASAPSVRQREIPAPAAGAVAAATGTASTQPASSQQGAAAATPASGRETGAANAPSGSSRPTAATGSGIERTPPGGATTPAPGDDWGASERARPGGVAGQGGLYDDQGRVRLADAPGSASARPPPGASEEIRDLDRAGTWLRRKPTDYEPTRFDRYWIPHETLLAEWVRRGIKEVAIPIPGTGKKLMCVVSVLQLGGGCGIADPNLNEQPATARPPPDIPFKPHLQEDNGSVKPPRAG